MSIRGFYAECPMARPFGGYVAILAANSPEVNTSGFLGEDEKVFSAFFFREDLLKRFVLGDLNLVLFGQYSFAPSQQDGLVAGKSGVILGLG
jgi:hypothetical protein